MAGFKYPDPPKDCTKSGIWACRMDGWVELRRGDKPPRPRHSKIIVKARVPRFTSTGRENGYVERDVELWQRTYVGGKRIGSLDLYMFYQRGQVLPKWEAPVEVSPANVERVLSLLKGER